VQQVYRGQQDQAQPVQVEQQDLLEQQDRQVGQPEPLVPAAQQDYEVQQDLMVPQAQQVSKATMDPQV
jgi:hypothetical protein